eukprot:3278727-Heterocapsa_arctica.AAC.1
MDIGDLHHNNARCLKTLESFTELKVLRYSGSNQDGCRPQYPETQEVLDLRALVKLEELVFE